MLHGLIVFMVRCAHVFTPSYYYALLTLLMRLPHR